MANAIKKISVQRGYDVSEYSFVQLRWGGRPARLPRGRCVGHQDDTCAPAGRRAIGLRDWTGRCEGYESAWRLKCYWAKLRSTAWHPTFERLESLARDEVAQQSGTTGQTRTVQQLSLKYQGTDSTLEVARDDLDIMRAEFDRNYRARFGFLMPGRALIVESISVECIKTSEGGTPQRTEFAPRSGSLPPQWVHPVFCGDRWRQTPFFDRDALRPGDHIDGPAVIREANATTVIEPGWSASLTPLNHLLLRRQADYEPASVLDTAADPLRLELFNNLFMAIAEQMGEVLAKTAYSVNIKERLDFSCALFDGKAQLVANAPHMPVHLGSMGESVLAILRRLHRPDAAGGCVRLECALCGGHALTRHHGSYASLLRYEPGPTRVFCRSARPPRRCWWHYARIHACALRSY